MWKHRKTIPTIQLTQFAVDRGVSLEHLLTGIENVDTKNITIYPFRLFYRLRDMMDRPQEYIDALNSAIATNDPIFVSTIMRSMADVIERGNSGQGKQVENAGNSIKDKQP